MSDPEEVEVFGRRFLVTVTGPDAGRRYAATIWEPAAGRTLTRSPVRGRSAAEVREKVVEVLHTLVGIDRAQEQILAVAAELAPGASVELVEDAQAIRAMLAGGWELAVPLALPRDDVTDPEADIAALRRRIVDHFRAHLRRVR
ncbi:MAG: hypothetical protein QN155_07215 [Armatimonadota bacterium]|nr:hypothetical protein [Armatimonadota bacterium]MDR7404915.1 hypothetical protein [Armatimonadota bacterium]